MNECVDEWIADRKKAGSNKLPALWFEIRFAIKLLKTCQPVICEDGEVKEVYCTIARFWGNIGR